MAGIDAAVDQDYLLINYKYIYNKKKNVIIHRKIDFFFVRFDMPLADRQLRFALIIIYLY